MAVKKTPPTLLKFIQTHDIDLSDDDRASLVDKSTAVYNTANGTKYDKEQVRKDYDAFINVPPPPPPEYEDGIYEGKNDISIEDYHRNRTHISSTALRHLRQSPKHFKEYYFKEQVRKSHFDFGNAFEIALLDPKNFERRVKVIDSDEKIREILKERPKITRPTSTTDYKRWHEEQSMDERYIIEKVGTESRTAIDQMLESCYQDAIIQALIKNVSYQCSIFWTDTETGLRLKTRPDIIQINQNVVLDVKTALDASPGEWTKVLGRHHLGIQACMQIDGLLQSGRMECVDMYYWLVVEKTPPYCAVLYRFQPEDRDWNMNLYRHWKYILGQAFEKDIWPGYQQRADNKYGILDAEFPGWYRSLLHYHID